MFVHPNSLALSFILLTKASTVPAIFSAIATAESLAEAIIIDLSKSSTFKVVLGSKNTCEPPILEALLLIITSSVKLSSPLSIASSIRSIVIILVIEAGAIFSSTFFS